MRVAGSTLVRIAHILPPLRTAAVSYFFRQTTSGKDRNRLCCLANSFQSEQPVLDLEIPQRQHPGLEAAALQMQGVNDLTDVASPVHHSFTPTFGNLAARFIGHGHEPRTRKASVDQSLQRELQELKQIVMSQQSELAQLKSHRGAGHATCLTQEDFQVLPQRIILLRHAQSVGNCNEGIYCITPDYTVQLSEEGKQQALAAGQQLKDKLTAWTGTTNFKLHFMMSPYERAVQTYQLLAKAFAPSQIAAAYQEVQLREQDFGNFQDPVKIKSDLDERNKFGRFWYRFPNGESGADVYDRMSMFEDHLLRDMVAGHFLGSNVVMVTHGLTMRVFLMRWLRWSTNQFLEVWNPANAEPILLERMPWEAASQLLKQYPRLPTQSLYRLSPETASVLQGCTPEMCQFPLT